ncbi:MAG: hypothetical protein LLG40_14505 [Deltaproteobacteria bacterium]|nr:hypothetical protein [Deltaproteobacteria bacterium]
MIYKKWLPKRYSFEQPKCPSLFRIKSGNHKTLSSLFTAPDYCNCGEVFGGGGGASGVDGALFNPLAFAF